MTFWILFMGSDFGPHCFYSRFSGIFSLKFFGTSMLFQSILKICKLSVLKILVFSSCFALLCYLYRQSRWSSAVTSPWAPLVDWHPQRLWIIHTVSKRAVPNLNHLSGSCLQPLQTFLCHFTLNDSIPNLLHMEAVAFTLFPEILTFHGSPFWSQALTTPGISTVCCMFMLSAIRIPLLTVFWTTELHKLSFSYLSHIQKSNSELKINCRAIWIQPKISVKDAPLLACSTYWQIWKSCMMVSEY